MNDKTRAAIQQALEYLRDNQHYIADNERHAYVMEYNAFVERLEALADHVPDATKMIEQPAQQEPKDPLKEAVYEFFTKYLNRVEYSDSDRPFNPITIGCCRVMMLKPLGDLLDKMRELSGAGPNPLEKTTK